MIRIASALALLLFLVGALDAAEPHVSVKTADAPSATRITFEATDKPVIELIETIARRMGFSEVIVKDPALRLPRGSCKFENKLAWTCLVELLEKHKMTWGGGQTGKDYALTLYPDKNRQYSYRVAGPLVARVWQAPVGTRVNNPLRNLPCRIWIRHEPGVSIRFSELAAKDQADASGKTANVIEFKLLGIEPQLRLTKNASPWPGLSKLTLQGMMRQVSRRATVTLTKLSTGEHAKLIAHEGNQLFTLDRVAYAGHFVDVHLSLASESQTLLVAQGGRGTPPEQALEALTDMRVAVLLPSGTQISPGVISAEGDGKRLKIMLRLSRHQVTKAGGIGTLSLRLSTTLKSKDVPFQMAFDGLAR